MPMRAKLGAADGFNTIENEKETDKLLREVKGISYEYDGHRNPYLALDDAKTKYYKYYQKENETNVSHFNTFRALAEVVEHHGGDIGRDDALVNLEIKKVLPKEDINTVGSEKLTLFRSISRSKALAIGFIKRSDRGRYGDLIDDLENHFSRGTDQYPPDLPKALNTIDCYVRGRTSNRNTRRPHPSAGDQEIEMTFAQVGSPVPGVDGILFDSITCFGCRQKGHYKSKCPAPEPPDIQLLQIDDDFVDTDPPDSTHEPHPSNPEEVNDDPADENEGGRDPDEEGDVFHSFGFLQEGSIQTQQPAAVFSRFVT